MGVRNLRNIVNFFGFIFMLIILAIWSSSLLIEWGTDFGGYYSGSFFLSEDYRLYHEYFEHKGPLYYLFLKGTGFLLGWGHLQAYFSLFLTLLIFYLPLFYILIKQKLSPVMMFSGICMSLLLLYGQNTNSSITFFQAGFMLVSFYLLLRHSQNEFILMLSFGLFVLSVFTRIDSIVYFPIYIFAALYHNGHLSFSRFVTRLFGFSLIIFIIYQFLSRSLDFNLDDFLIHNINFNSWYKSNSLISVINRPTHYTLLMSSLIVFPIFFLRNKIVEYISYFSAELPNLFKNDKLSQEGQVNLIYIAIFLLSTLIWLYSGSDKEYYLLLFSIPMVFLILFNLAYVNESKIWWIYLLLAFYPLGLTVGDPLRDIIKNSDCISTPYCNASAISGYSESIDFLKTQAKEEVTIIGGRGWTYFYSRKKPARSVNDWWLYERSEPFPTEALIEQHKNLLSAPIGELFLIDNVLLRNIDTKSELLKEVLSHSILVEKQRKYSVFKLIKSEKS